MNSTREWKYGRRRIKYDVIQFKVLYYMKFIMFTAFMKLPIRSRIL